MQECNCIIIDDKKDFATSAMMTNFLKRARENNNLQINLIQLNPKSEKFVDDDGKIVQERVVAELNTEQYLKQLVHLIACDYDLVDDGTNGFDVVRLLRNKLNSKKKILLYSSNIDNVIDKIINGQKNEIKEKIIDLVKSSISSFCQREGHLEEEIIKHLQEETIFSSDKQFETELYKYGKFKFKATYDKFENKTLGEMAEIISKQSHEGDRLKKELIQQVIAYMIAMENE